MQLHNVEQGSEEWHKLRLGKITGSGFSKLLSAKTRDKYLYDRANEIVTGFRCEGDYYSNEYMERGKDLEPIIRSKYKIFTFHDVTITGLVQQGDYLAYSPDGLVNSDGLLEIKNLNSNNYFKHIIEIVSKGTEAICKDHYWQMQFGMFVCEREWCDYMLYSDLHENTSKEILPYRVKFNKLERNRIEDVINESIEKIKFYVEQYRNFDPSQGYQKSIKAIG